MTCAPHSLQRILLTTDTIGGVWHYSLELAEALGRRGISVGLATMGAPLTSIQRREAAGLPRVEVFETSFKLEWMPDPWDDIDRAGQWLLELESEFEPDLIHLNQFSFGALPWKQPCLVVGHSCVFSWHEAVWHAAPGPEWGEYFHRVSRGLQNASAVVAPSRAMLDSLQRHYGPISSPQVIYNGRQPDRFSPLQKLPLIFSAGRFWDEAKN